MLCREVLDREMLAMEKDFDSKLRIQDNNPSNGGNSILKSKSFAFRAPQENFTIQDFDLGKIYGVGSYSKVCTFWLFVTFGCLFGLFPIWVFGFLIGG